MIPFRFLHAADLHLDSPFKGVADVPAAVRRHIRESTFRALGNLTGIAIRERVRFVLVSGDIYDLADRSLSARFRFGEAAEELERHGIKLYVIHGNHDPLESGRETEWPRNVHVFGSGKVETVIHRDESGRPLASISGISYDRPAVHDNLVPLFPKPDPSVYSIAMLHTNADGDRSHDNYAPCAKEELIRAGYHYWALGHIHARQVLHETPHIVYPGNIQGRSVKETGSKGCYVVDVGAGGETKLSFHPADAVRWERREIPIGDLGAWQDLTDRLEREMAVLQEEHGGMPVIVRFVLSGRGPLHRLLQEGRVLQETVAGLRDEAARQAESGGSFVWIESCRVQTGAPVPVDALMEQASFAGDLLRLSEKLLADEEALREFCGAALAPLAGNIRAGKYLQSFSAEDWRRLLMAARELAVGELAAEGAAGEGFAADQPFGGDHAGKAGGAE